MNAQPKPPCQDFLSLTLIYPHLSATKRPKHSCTYNIKLTAELQGLLSETHGPHPVLLLHCVIGSEQLTPSESRSSEMCNPVKMTCFSGKDDYSQNNLSVERKDSRRKAVMWGRMVVICYLVDTFLHIIVCYAGNETHSALLLNPFVGLF